MFFFSLGHCGMLIDRSMQASEPSNVMALGLISRVGEFLLRFM